MPTRTKSQATSPAVRSSGRDRSSLLPTGSRRSSSTWMRTAPRWSYSWTASRRSSSRTTPVRPGRSSAADFPAGKAVAVGDNPDDLLYGARNRLYVSRNGGIFWRVLGVELPEVRDVAWG